MESVVGCAWRISPQFPSREGLIFLPPNEHARSLPCGPVAAGNVGCWNWLRWFNYNALLQSRQPRLKYSGWTDRKHASLQNVLLDRSVPALNLPSLPSFPTTLPYYFRSFLLSCTLKKKCEPEPLFSLIFLVRERYFWIKMLFMFMYNDFLVLFNFLILFMFN